MRAYKCDACGRVFSACYDICKEYSNHILREIEKISSAHNFKREIKLFSVIEVC